MCENKSCEFFMIVFSKYKIPKKRFWSIKNSVEYPDQSDCDDNGGLR